VYRLNIHIYRHLLERGFTKAAAALLQESKISPSMYSPVIATSFLSDWWGVFWDVYSATNAEGETEAGNKDAEDSVKVMFTNTVMT
jgi:hypothetical protein